VKTCPRCGARFEVSADTCAGCGTRLRAEASAPRVEEFDWAEFRRLEMTGEGPSTIPCPRCGTKLTEVRYGDLALDECRSCGGCWYDRGEMERALQRFGARKEEASGGEVPGRVRRHVLADTQVRYLNCPKCGDAMSRVNYESCSGVMVDRCRACGVWLDRAELEKIHEFLESGGLEYRRKRDEEARQAEKRRWKDLFPKRGRYGRESFGVDLFPFSIYLGDGPF
jgi:Zn-finger nucleic acid-binding protein